ncbi:type II secretion system protein GspG [Pseudoalteromonas sp. MTN2-4]|uniref:type II secretion system protein GspG n=1 Tax=Pseudoalteromonas sp. MTN2-4 TaxID=3056555 RepID=UPI0036F27F74
MQNIKVLIFLIAIFASSFVNSSSKELSEEEKAHIDIVALSKAVEFYHNEFGYFPTNEQGLDVLVQEILVSKSCPCKKEKIISTLPQDPWGRDYLYLSPGIRNPDSFDIWTNGMDGLPDGKGEYKGCGNWDALDCGQINDNKTFSPVFLLIIFGFGVGIPPYILGVYLAYKKEGSVKKSLFGYHFGILCYFILVTLLLTILPSLF